MLGRKPVIHRHHRQPGFCPDLGADIVMAVQPADNEAAAVQIDHYWRPAGIDAAGHAGHAAVFGADAGGIAAVELPAHGVIDLALARDRESRGLRRIEGIGATDEGPGRGVDKGLVIRGCHRAPVAAVLSHHGQPAAGPQRRDRSAITGEMPRSQPNFAA